MDRGVFVCRGATNIFKGNIMTNAMSDEGPAKTRPALKLVKTQDLSRDQWLAVRKGGLGSSDGHK